MNGRLYITLKSISYWLNDLKDFLWSAELLIINRAFNN
jgi:hypothetical protein